MPDFSRQVWSFSTKQVERFIMHAPISPHRWLEVRAGLTGSKALNCPLSAYKQDQLHSECQLARKATGGKMAEEMVALWHDSLRLHRMQQIKTLPAKTQYSNSQTTICSPSPLSTVKQQHLLSYHTAHGPLPRNRQTSGKLNMGFFWNGLATQQLFLCTVLGKQRTLLVQSASKWQEQHYHFSPVSWRINKPRQSILLTSPSSPEEAVMLKPHHLTLRKHSSSPINSVFLKHSSHEPTCQKRLQSWK